MTITTGSFTLFKGSPSIMDSSLAYVTPLRVAVEGTGFYLVDDVPANQECEHFPTEGRLDFFEEPDTPMDGSSRNVFVMYKY